jgi:hypothetical protein
VISDNLINLGRALARRILSIQPSLVRSMRASAMPKTKLSRRKAERRIRANYSGEELGERGHQHAHAGGFLSPTKQPDFCEIMAGIRKSRKDRPQTAKTALLNR